MSAFFDISYVSQPAVKEAGRIFIEGILYDMKAPRLGENYVHYAVCANCDLVHKFHIQQKCPFESTDFKFVHDPNYKMTLADKMDYEREQDHAKQIQNGVEADAGEP